MQPNWVSVACKIWWGNSWFILFISWREKELSCHSFWAYAAHQNLMVDKNKQEERNPHCKIDLKMKFTRLHKRISLNKWIITYYVLENDQVFAPCGGVGFVSKRKQVFAGFKAFTIHSGISDASTSTYQKSSPNCINCFWNPLIGYEKKKKETQFPPGIVRS